MPSPVNLTTTDDAIRALEKLVDGTKKRNVSVNREELDRLLIDYGILLNAVRGSGSFKVTLPQPLKRRTMPKLSP